MIVCGELENVPLLDVLQVLTHSSQTGALYIDGGTIVGTVVLDKGAIVCAESSSTRLLLAQAARQVDPGLRRSFRRAQLLACLTELFSVRSGTFRFKKLDDPLAELTGVETGSFYAAGGLATAEILLVYATAIEREEPKQVAGQKDPDGERAHPRFSPTLIEAEFSQGDSTLKGYITNVSVGGAFFQGASLPEVDSVSQLRFDLPGEKRAVVATARVAWARSEAAEGDRGVGLAFESITAADRKKVEAYLERFKKLATDMDLTG